MTTLTRTPSPFAVPEWAIVRRAERIDPLDDRKLRKAIDEGRWHRVAAGVFVVTGEWRKLTPLQRHRLLVHEVTRGMRDGAVVSHYAAAAEWEMDILGSWPDRVDVTIDRARGGRSSGAIRRHALGIDAEDVVAWGSHFFTTPARTAIDLARVLPFAAGVAVIDQAIRTGREGDALTTSEGIRDLLATSPAHRGNARARRAVEFADPLAANVRETDSRVAIAQLGFPAPRLQERRVLRSGRVVYGDFYFPEHDHWGELDGRGKYLSPEFGADRDPAEIVLDEKARENEIRREVRGFSRWEPADASSPRRLYDILTGDGLPSRLPRP